MKATVVSFLASVRHRDQSHLISAILADAQSEVPPVSKGFHVAHPRLSYELMQRDIMMVADDFTLHWP